MGLGHDTAAVEKKPDPKRFTTLTSRRPCGRVYWAAGRIPIVPGSCTSPPSILPPAPTEMGMFAA